MPSHSTLLGAAGAHHVMAELLRRGYIAALAPEGVPTVDILVTDVGGARLCSIQVKARRDIGSDGGWHLKDKHEKIHSDRLFYCFVDFGKAPDTCAIVYVCRAARLLKLFSLRTGSGSRLPERTGNRIKIAMCVDCSPITPASSGRPITHILRDGSISTATLGTCSS